VVGMGVINLADYIEESIIDVDVDIVKDETRVGSFQVQIYAEKVLDYVTHDVTSDDSDLNSEDDAQTENHHVRKSLASNLKKRFRRSKKREDDKNPDTNKEVVVEDFSSEKESDKSDYDTSKSKKKNRTKSKDKNQIDTDHDNLDNAMESDDEVDMNGSLKPKKHSKLTRKKSKKSDSKTVEFSVDLSKKEIMERSKSKSPRTLTDSRISKSHETEEKSNEFDVEDFVRLDDVLEDRSLGKNKKRKLKKVQLEQEVEELQHVLKKKDEIIAKTNEHENQMMLVIEGLQSKFQDTLSEAEEKISKLNTELHEKDERIISLRIRLGEGDLIEHEKLEREDPLIFARREIFFAMIGILFYTMCLLSYNIYFQ